LWQKARRLGRRRTIAGLLVDLDATNAKFAHLDCLPKQGQQVDPHADVAQTDVSDIMLDIDRTDLHAVCEAAMHVADREALDGAEPRRNLRYSKTQYGFGVPEQPECDQGQHEQ